MKQLTTTLLLLSLIKELTGDINIPFRANRGDDFYELCFSLFVSYVNESSGMTTLVTYKSLEPAYVDQVSNILIESVTRHLPIY